jgi:hypothetical protein
MKPIKEIYEVWGNKKAEREETLTKNGPGFATSSKSRRGEFNSVTYFSSVPSLRVPILQREADAQRLLECNKNNFSVDSPIGWQSFGTPLPKDWDEVQPEDLVRLMNGAQQTIDLFWGLIWKGCLALVIPIAVELAARVPMVIVWGYLSIAMHEFFGAMHKRKSSLPMVNGKKQTKRNPLHVVQYFKNLLLESVYNKGSQAASNALLAGLRYERRGYQIRPPRPDGSISGHNTNSAPKSTNSRQNDGKKSNEDPTTDHSKKISPEKTICLRDLAYSKNIHLPSRNGKPAKPCRGKTPDATFPCRRLHSEDYKTWTPQQLWDGVRTTGYLNDSTGTADVAAIKTTLGLAT